MKKIIVYIIVIICIIIASIISKNIAENSNSIQDTKNTNSTSEEENNIDERTKEYISKMQDPNHWSETEKKKNLAYALTKDKNRDLADNDFITNPDKIISSELPTNANGIFIAYDSRVQIEQALKSEVNDIFYIDENGLLKYDKNKDLKVKDTLTKFFISAIDDTEKLYVIDISFAYIDEELGKRDVPMTFDGDFDYLTYNIDEKTELIVYNRYNYRFEILVEGIQKLTDLKLETK